MAKLEKERESASAASSSGRTATVGLRNFGNSCFLSSSLQCLAHIPSFRDYFLDDAYRDSLRIGGKDSVQTAGRVAEEFAGLLQRLWAEDSKSFAPQHFKDVIGEINASFRDADQHDSMEFTEFLVDTLREDCNRIKGKKPYIERKDANGRPDRVVALEACNSFLMRNDSVLDDVFVGFTKTASICPQPCGHPVAIFDEFSSLKVPVVSPQWEDELRFVVFAVPCMAVGGIGSIVTRHRVTTQKSGGAPELLSVASHETGLCEERCVLVEVYEGRLYKEFLDRDRLQDISPADVLVLYELKDVASAKAFAASGRSWVDAPARLAEGDLVVAKVGFKSNSERKRPIRQGMVGRVRRVDEEGDALVKFDNIEREQWIFSKNFRKLQVNADMDSGEQREGERYTCTFRQLVDRNEDEFFYEALEEIWRDSMRPVGGGEEDALCSVVLHFRRRVADGKEELYGLPVLFCMPQESTWPELTEAIRQQLRQRLGGNCPSRLRVFRASCSFDAAHAEDLLDEMEDPASGLREREYLVAEWDDGLPKKIVDAFAEADAHAENGEDEVTLENCFDWFTEQEQLTEDNKMYCPGCRSQQRIFRKTDFWSLPPVLVVQLKRFAYVGMQRQRLTTPVHFPLEGLDMRRFCLSEESSFPDGDCIRAGARVAIHSLQSEAGQGLNGLEGTAMYFNTATERFCIRLKNGDAPEDWKRLKVENLKPVGSSSSYIAPPPLYDLVAINKHIGSAHYGHYVAFVRSSQDGKWRLYDDDNVKEVTEKEVAGERVGAYVLFYVRRDHRPRGWPRAEGWA